MPEVPGGRFAVDQDMPSGHEWRQERVQLGVPLIRQVFEEDGPCAGECHVEFVYNGAAA